MQRRGRHPITYSDDKDQILDQAAKSAAQQIARSGDKAMVFSRFLIMLACAIQDVPAVARPRLVTKGQGRC